VNKNFELFKAEFAKYQQIFGLQGYKVYFEHTSLDDCFADITTNQREMVTTVRFDPAKRTHTVYPEKTAKHEALHLLTNRLADLAANRYTTEREVYEAWEELVRKLECLIP